MYVYTWSNSAWPILRLSLLSSMSSLTRLMRRMGKRDFDFSCFLRSFWISSSSSWEGKEVQSSKSKG